MEFVKINRLAGGQRLASEKAAITLVRAMGINQHGSVRSTSWITVTWALSEDGCGAGGDVSPCDMQRTAGVGSRIGDMPRAASSQIPIEARMRSQLGDDTAIA